MAAAAGQAGDGHGPFCAGRSRPRAARPSPSAPAPGPSGAACVPQAGPGGGRACPGRRCRGAESPPVLGVRGSLRPAAGAVTARGVPVGAVTVAWAAGFHRCGLRAREAGVGRRWASLPGPSGP